MPLMNHEWLLPSAGDFAKIPVRCTTAAQRKASIKDWAVTFTMLRRDTRNEARELTFKQLAEWQHCFYIITVVPPGALKDHLLSAMEFHHGNTPANCSKELVGNRVGIHHMCMYAAPLQTSPSIPSSI